ncbi:MAG TPA: copper resistance protein CopC [Chloroflexota bacterium]|nr:copper resistance protein CopC [Chloroflexota bacterium]
MLFPGRASAHAHLVRADLTPDSHLIVQAGAYRFWFDEVLNPALSRIVIRDGQGRQVNAGTGRLNPANAEELDLTLPALASGQYSVAWTSDSSQDGHVLHGFYLFTVGGAGAVVPSAVPTTTIVSASPALDSAALAMALAHWLVLLSTVLWTGLLALEILVLSPAQSEPGRPAPELALLASRRGRHVARLALLGALLASLAELEAQGYASGGWAGMGSAIVLGDILRSHYGTLWVIRMFLTLLTYLALRDGLAGLLVRTLRPPVVSLSSNGGGGDASWLSARVAGVLGLASLLALALSGHAASVPQLLVTSVLLDWLHLLTTAVWIGGMAAIAVALLPALALYSAASDAARREGRLAFLALLDRFTPAAYLAVATAVTGMFNAQVHLGSLDQLTGTTYGRFLLVKMALIAEMTRHSRPRRSTRVRILRPRVLTLLATIQGRQPRLVASPLLPGSNRLELTLSDSYIGQTC